MIYEEIYNKLDKLIEDLPNLQQGEYRKSHVNGFMDLHLDVLEVSKSHIKIALQHYYTNEGDAIPDPDMEIFINPEQREAEALSYQDQYGYREVYPEGTVNPKAKAELNNFLNFWLKNLLSQGHRLKTP